MIELKNKVAVITGAANGLGKALAIELYRQGFALALIDIDFSGLQNLKNNLQSDGQLISVHKADVSDEKTVSVTHKSIIEQHHRINMLINNAGISISQPFEIVKLSDYKRLFEVNFWGTVYCTKYFLPDLKNQTNSRLVNIISETAFMGFPDKTTYASSKSAIMGFTNSLYTELADTSAKVCLVIPPPLDTGLVKNGIHVDNHKRKIEAEYLKKKGMPLDKTAKRIIKQVKKGKYRIIVGTMMFWIDIFSRLFPTLTHKMIGKYKSRFEFV